MTGYTKAWAAWVILTLSSFGVIERRALKIQGATLSEHLRTGFGFDNVGPLPRIRRAIFVAAWAWFGIHIFSKTAGCLPSEIPAEIGNVIQGD